MHVPGIPHWFGLVPPQTWLPPHVVCPAGQQSMMPLHVSVAMPQLKPCCAQVFGTQTGAPQMPGVPPPPQVWLAGQVPQLIELPHPSPCMPQLKFS